MRKVKNLLFVICLTLLFSNYTTLTNKKNKLFKTEPSIKKEKVIFTSKLIGDDIEVGTLKITSKDKTNLLVTFKIKKGWSLDKSNLFIGDYNDIPLKENGCPNLKKNKNQTKHASGITKFSYKIPLSKLKKVKCISILSKAVVTKGNKTISAWSQGESFSCNKDIKYSQLCKSSMSKKALKSSAKKELSSN